MEKILIAVPCMDQVPARFAHSLASLKMVGECALWFEIGSLIYTSRNNICKKAIEMDADYVMWFDSDMMFAPDTMERMYKFMQKEKLDMVSGLYFRRVPPFTPVLFDRLDVDANGTCFWTEVKDIPDKPFEVGGCGFGCVLMRTDVIMNVQGKFGELFTPIGRMGEDLSFCWRARQCNFKIVCDPRIDLGHVGTMVTNRDFYESYRGGANA